MRPRGRRIIIPDESVQASFDRRKISRPTVIVRMRDTTVVGPDGQVDAACGFIEEEPEPDRSKPSGVPWVEVIVRREIDVDDAEFIQFLDPRACKAGCLCQADVRIRRSFAVYGTVIEP